MSVEVWQTKYIAKKIISNLSETNEAPLTYSEFVLKGIGKDRKIAWNLPKV